ncbi:hypothetical protein [Parvularcula sp. LCG005]|uniref:hypothetical protein n=1 Tax=Parvularcula sp. LCG005 TaxID=3078805 RepID=UPI002943886F|nr:hypothetical protein [Parvularcula sp. LCG005]WOI53129.1 hypothetical protein RUI03_13345 [Parvularcula sp. LCG005]
MFFRRKQRDAAAETTADTADLAADAAVEGTAPELVEVSELSADAETDTSHSLTVAETGTELDNTSETIRLFPGFERDDFEVGYRTGGDVPALVLRWKDGGEWFTMPGLFNRGILSAMDERESASDLNRLLRNYGYDVEADRS